MELLDQMRGAGVRPDVVTFSSLIAACQACGGRWQAALALLEQMEAEGARLAAYPLFLWLARAHKGVPTCIAEWRKAEGVHVYSSFIVCVVSQGCLCPHAMRRMVSVCSHACVRQCSCALT